MSNEWDTISFDGRQRRGNRFLASNVLSFDEIDHDKRANIRRQLGQTCIENRGERSKTRFENVDSGFKITVSDDLEFTECCNAF
jgi:hypothetical protein